MPCSYYVTLTCLLHCFTYSTLTIAATPQRVVLIDSAKNYQHETLQLDGRSVGDPAKSWALDMVTLKGGKQNGCQVITLKTSDLTIRVIPTRGMSILDVTSGDVRLGWNSPVQEVVHPSYIDLESRGGLGWLEGFNEWMVRCGLEFAGHPGTDVFINNTGDEATMDLTLHGKIGNIPASFVEFVIDQEAPFALRIRGTVYEKFFYGPKLKLVSEIAIVPGEQAFTLTDIVTNEGAGEQEMQLIYHTNYGAPLLEAGAQVTAAVQKISPMNAHAAQAIDNYQTYAGPTAGFIEEVFLVHPISSADGRTLVALTNADGNRGAAIEWSTAELPYLTIWKNTAATADGYVTGLEPATGFPFNRRVERHYNRVPKLAAGETRRFSLQYSIQTTAEQVNATLQRIQTLQGDIQPQIERMPPEIPE